MNNESMIMLGQQLAAIEPPPAPNWWPWIISASVVSLGLITILAVLLFRRYKHNTPPSVTQEALQQLARLRCDWQQQTMDEHTVAYHLATILRLGLGLKQLTTAAPQHLSTEQHRWQQTIQQLQQLRYNPKRTEAGLNDALFDQAQQWIEGYPLC